MSKSLVVGSKAPNFKYLFSDGTKESLNDYIGNKVLVCFYPKDNTPGCTAEVCSLTDSISEFDKRKIKIFGVSKDNELSHNKFVNKYNLKIRLIPDPDLKIIKKYGVLNEKGSAKRTSFLIDENGKILNIWIKVNTKSHAEEVLEFLDKN
ncbi:peroxiredoxin [bacterium]|nr:peroxiredoxin [bacterium]|tara:strand:- start:6488 stop:6937 length:450 start_codon:yes stop_codon:yes gene_type:complete